MIHVSSNLYIHVPWCIKKCPYCDFNSHELAKLSADDKGKLEKSYAIALLNDLEQECLLIDDKRPLKTIFIGGGTPSLMSSDFYDTVLSGVKSLVGIDALAEVTLEANPGTIDIVNFEGYRGAGINRISMGVQSFDDEALHRLGRIHSSDDVIRAYERAREAGFDNINLDIMHGLPHQSVAKALADLDRAIDLSPEHISWYQLTIEKNTAFYSQPPQLPDENILDDIGGLGLARLNDAGYIQYEVSAYARNEKQSEHNKNYWQFGDYIGIGAGAHGKLTTQKNIVRRWKTRVPENYLNANTVLAGETVIAKEDLVLEYMMNALRLTQGFELKDFEEKTRLSFELIDEKITALVKKKLLIKCDGRVMASSMGQRYLDSVLAEF